MFLKNQIFQQNDENIIGKRYNLNMMSNIRRRQIHPSEENNNQANNKTQENNIKRSEKFNKIKSLRISEPKNNIKWSEDYFEQIKIEEQKNKIKSLKIVEPKDHIVKKSDIDLSNNNNWYDDSYDWIEKENNICV